MHLGDRGWKLMHLGPWGGHLTSSAWGSTAGAAPDLFHQEPLKPLVGQCVEDGVSH